MREAIPRPEHPRPDFQRGRCEGVDWLNLNGRWEFRFDPDDKGEAEGWFKPDFNGYDSEIIVPFPWESLAAWGEEDRAANYNFFSKRVYRDPKSVVGPHPPTSISQLADLMGGFEVPKGNYREAPRHEIGWYRRWVEIPANWRDRRVILKFGAVDWHAKVWVNGQLVGEHEGGYSPFELDITDHIHFDRSNCIVVRAYDPQDHSEQPAGKQIGWYQRTSGIWQTVYMEPRPETYIDLVHIYPDIDSGKATFKVRVRNLGEAGSIRITVTSPRGERLSREYPLPDEEVLLEFPIPDPLLWEPETPHLYGARVELAAGGEVIDAIDTYFGMRKISTDRLPGRDYRYIFLNNHPVYLRGALDQSFNPWGIYTFPSDEAIKLDLERAKRFGFNFLRLHIKIEEPRFFYWADRLGVMLMCDMPNFARYTEKSKERWERTLRDAIERDFNHPSIIAWCLFNETWGLHPYDEERQEWVRSMYELAKKLDPTRLVEDMSPCRYDHVKTDINSWHFYINDYERAKKHIAEVVEKTYPGSTFNYTGENRQGDEPLMNSEYGGISAGMGDMDVSWAFKFLTNELRLHEKICGYVYTELMDIEWEHNGFMNYDRTVKEFGYDPALLNSADFVAIDHPPGKRFRPGEIFRADVYVSHFSNREVREATLRWRLDGVDRWGMPRPGLATGAVEVPFERYRVEKVHTIELKLPEECMHARLHVWVEDEGGAVLAWNFVDMEIFDIRPPRLERCGGSIVIRFTPGDKVRSEWDAEERIHRVEGIGDVVWGRDVGYFEYEVDPTVPVEEIKGMRLIFEASSGTPTLRQTEPRKIPTDLTISINGVEVKTITIPDAPADSRGALSYINGLPGKYGFLMNVEVPGRLMGTIKAASRGRKLTLAFKVKGSARNRNGLILFGCRTGRYPVDPCLILLLDSSTSQSGGRG